MKAAARFDVVRKETKADKLAAFIRRQVAREQLEFAPPALVCRAVARSYDSLVITALSAAAREPSGPELHIEALLTAFAGVAANAKAALEFSTGNSRCRLGRDPRLLDAHEMLVIGRSTVWIGDCMRRDPARCDSYECYSEACGATAAEAILFFERLWRAAATPGQASDAAREIATRRDAFGSSFPPASPASIVIPTRH